MGYRGKGTFSNRAHFFQKGGAYNLRTKDRIKRTIVERMKVLGTYKPQYLELINIFSGMIHQYEMFEAEFIENGSKIEEKYTNKSGATNMRKTPLFSAIENLRRDIAMYSDKLMLNPKSYIAHSSNCDESDSKLTEVLNNLEKKSIN